MKNLMTCCALILCLSVANAQSFEGTIRWTMKMDITDPKAKAEMQQAQKKMNDPEKQAELKEMNEKMNDPEFKKMMESNPQMKAQMEKMMKMSSGGGDASSMMPTGMLTKIKGVNTLSIMEGGMAGGMEMLHFKDKASVRLDRANKTFTTMPSGQGKPSGTNPSQAKVTKTTETAKLLGYTCTKYLVQVMEQGTPTTQVFWTTTEIKDMDMKSMSRQSMGQDVQPLFYDQIEGVPLKMVVSSPQGNMIMEVMEIKREKLNDSDFQIPADFKEVKMR